MKPFSRDIICEVAALKWDVVICQAAGLLSFVVGSIVESSVLEMIGASVTGAVLMGIAFAILSAPKDTRTFVLRWITNLFFGVPLGLFLAFKYRGMFPDVPGWVVSGLFSGLAGPLIVGLTIIGPPYFNRGAQNFFEWFLGKLQTWFPIPNRTAPPPPNEKPAHNPPIGTSGTGGTNQGDAPVSKGDSGMANLSDGG